jgi:hypothetical protein
VTRRPPGFDRIDAGTVDRRDVDTEVERARGFVAGEVLPRVVEVASDRMRSFERPERPRVRRLGGVAVAESAPAGAARDYEPDGDAEESEDGPTHDRSKYRAWTFRHTLRIALLRAPLTSEDDALDGAGYVTVLELE